MILDDIVKLYALTTNLAAGAQAMCNAIDSVTDAATTPWDCCSNFENGKTQCFKRSDLQNNFVSGITTGTAGTAGFCQTTDAQCL